MHLACVGPAPDARTQQQQQQQQPRSLHPHPHHPHPHQPTHVYPLDALPALQPREALADGLAHDAVVRPPLAQEPALALVAVEPPVLQLLL